LKTSLGVLCDLGVKYFLQSLPNGLVETARRAKEGDLSWQKRIAAPFLAFRNLNVSFSWQFQFATTGGGLLTFSLIQPITPSLSHELILLTFIRRHWHERAPGHGRCGPGSPTSDTVFPSNDDGANFLE
jgi:hypothetical protein